MNVKPTPSYRPAVFWAVTLFTATTVLISLGTHLVLYRQTGAELYLFIIAVDVWMLSGHFLGWWYAGVRQCFGYGMRLIALSQIIGAIINPYFVVDHWLGFPFLMVTLIFGIGVVEEPKYLSRFVPWSLLGIAGVIAVDLLAPPDRLIMMTNLPEDMVGAVIFLPAYTGALMLVAWFISRPKASGKRYLGWDLTTQLSLIFTLISAVSVFLVTAVFVLQVRALQIERIGQNYQSQVEIYATRVGDHIAQQIDLLTAIGRQDSTIFLGLRQANALYPASAQEARALITKNEQLWQTSAENSSFIRAYRNNNMTLVLNKFRGNNAFHSNIFITDRWGGLVAAQGEKPEKFFYGNEDWWQAAWNNDWGGIYIGKLVFDPQTNVPSIFMAVGILNPQTNQIVGVLASTYKLHSLQRDFRSANFKMEGEMVLTDPDGRAIAGSSDLQMGQVIWPELAAPVNFSSSGTSVLTPDWTMEPNIQDEAAILAYAPLSASDVSVVHMVRRLGWLVVAGDTQMHALAEVNRSIEVISLVGVLTMVAGVLIIMAVARIITRPIDALTKVASGINRGWLDLQAEPAGSVEMVTLAEAFNALTTQLRGLINNLQQQVSQRTAELEARAAELVEANRKAEEARLAAESANKAKSQFLAHMSHELRTPLNGILGYAQILKMDDTLNESQRDGLNIIQQSGEHLLNLLNDVLDLSKIEAGKMEIQPADFYLPGFLLGLTDIIGLRAKQKGINFTYQPFDFINNRPDNSVLPTTVHGDERRMRQILINLLGNAVKFTQRGEVIFRVGPVNTPKSDDGVSQLCRLRFLVQDTGVGISPDQLETIFEPFQQVSARKYQAEGTGLGLPISRNLVRMIGSELQVESRPGQGSVFWFDVDMLSAKDVLPPPLPDQRTIVGYEGERQKILVMDDNISNRSVLVSILSPLGFQVLEAENGQDGLEKAARFKPEVILVDLIMPVIDGLAFARRVRQSPELRSAVLIAVSANVFQDDRQQSLEAGCDAFIPKPIQTQTLLNMLQTQLHLRWIYRHGKPDNLSASSPAEDSAPPVIPPIADLALLYNLALMGDVKAIQTKVDTLVARDPRLAPFGSKVMQLVKGFQIDKICAFLEAYLEDVND